MPLVSIVLPVYNTEPYLEQCLDSLTLQTFTDFELICVDDGSTDASLKLLYKYAAKDSRIRVLAKQNEGKGAASARNLGLEHATGKYVQFLDSDDFFEPDLLECLVSGAEQTNSDLALCRAERFDNRSKCRERDYAGIDFSLLPEKNPFSVRDCPETIFQIADWIVWNKLFRRDLLERYVLRFEEIPISDDQYVPTLALVLAERITAVNRVLIHYRVNTGSSQIDNQAKHPAAAYAATYSVVEKLREFGVYSTLRKSYLNVALRVFREYFDRMTEYSVLDSLYRQYREVELPRLDAEQLSEDFFYDHRLWEWYQLLTTRSLPEILFEAARGHGDGMTTAVLRFHAPLQALTPGSRVVLVGKGRAGRYWYSQLLLSERCEVAAWVSSKEELSTGISFDQIIYAK